MNLFFPDRKDLKEQWEANGLCKVWPDRREKRALAHSWKRKVAVCLFYGWQYLAIIILCCRWRAVNRCLWSHSMAIAYLAVASAQARKRIQRCWGMTTGTNISWASGQGWGHARLNVAAFEVIREHLLVLQLALIKAVGSQAWSSAWRDTLARKERLFCSGHNTKGDDIASRCFCRKTQQTPTMRFFQEPRGLNKLLWKVESRNERQRRVKWRLWHRVERERESGSGIWCFFYFNQKQRRAPVEKSMTKS